MTAFAFTVETKVEQVYGDSEKLVTCTVLLAGVEVFREEHYLYNGSDMTTWREEHFESSTMESFASYLERTIRMGQVR